MKFSTISWNAFGAITIFIMFGIFSLVIDFFLPIFYMFFGLLFSIAGYDFDGSLLSIFIGEATIEKLNTALYLIRWFFSELLILTLKIFLSVLVVKLFFKKSINWKICLILYWIMVLILVFLFYKQPSHWILPSYINLILISLMFGLIIRIIYSILKLAPQGD